MLQVRLLLGLCSLPVLLLADLTVQRSDDEGCGSLSMLQKASELRLPYSGEDSSALQYTSGRRLAFGRGAAAAAPITGGPGAWFPAWVLLALLVACGGCVVAATQGSKSSDGRLAPWLALALVLLVLTCLSLRVALVSNFYAIDVYDAFTLFEVLSFTGYEVFRALFAVVLAVITQVVVCHQDVSFAAKTAWLWTMIVFCTTVIVVGCYMAREVLQCGIVFCWGMETEGKGSGDGMGLRANEGLLAALPALMLLIAHVLLLPRLSRTVSPVQPARARSVGWRRCAASTALALGVVPLLFLLTALLPNNFQKLHLKDGEANYRLPSQMAWVVDDAEVPGAWMKTINWRISPVLVLKFYPDTIIFYGFLEILAVTALAAASMPSFGRALHKHQFLGFSRGECLVLALFWVMLVLYTYYWAFQHWWGHVGWKFNNAGGITSPVASNWEVVARTFGMLSILFMSLALLPASKSSLWLEALGIGWERGVWAHRWMGAAMLITMALHALAFWVRWQEMGIFPRELRYPSYYPLEPNSQLDINKPNGHNMTVYMMQILGYSSLVLMGLFPLFRRRNYELFKYFHYTFLILIPAAAFLHAHNGWYFPVGGVAFWLVDAGLRLVCGATPRKLVDATAFAAEGGITRLTFELAVHETCSYVWINIPQISLLEWHPFSVSSSPLDSTTTVHVKNMGNNQFTGKLHALVSSGQGAEPAFTLSVDGPYGGKCELEGHGAVLLVAGGIGITPMHATLRHLVQLAGLGRTPPGLQLVRLIFIARSSALMNVFRDTICEALQHDGSGTKFSAWLYVTGEIEEMPDFGSRSERGRPNFGQVYDQVIEELGSDSSVLVKFCGPPSMDRSALEATRGRKQLLYESEGFEL